MAPENTGPRDDTEGKAEEVEEMNTKATEEWKEEV